MSRDSSGVRSRRAPSASSTSAEPHFDVKDRLPCFTTGKPHAAATTAAAVDTLIDPEKSPPVPQLSANKYVGEGNGRAAPRSARAAPISSSEVSPLMRNATNAAAINGSGSDPSTMRLKRSRADSRSRSSPSSSAAMLASDAASDEVGAETHPRGKVRIWLMQLTWKQKSPPLAGGHSNDRR